MPIHHGCFVYFWKNFCRTLFLSVLNSVVFFHWSIVCQLVTTTDLIELSIRNIVKRENKKQTKQHSRAGCEQNLWPFLYCGKDTCRKVLICLDATELQKGKTGVLVLGILIHYVTHFINQWLNVRTECILGPAQCIFTFSRNEIISYFFHAINLLRLRCCGIMAEWRAFSERCARMLSAWLG